MYSLAVYTPGKITPVTSGVELAEAQSIAETYCLVVDDCHIAIIGESGMTAEYWIAIAGKPTKFDARWNHMAYRDMMQAVKDA